MPAGRFKARCLALLDEVAETGLPLIITKHGKPVARLMPLEDAQLPSLIGSIRIVGDVVEPIDEDWDAEA